MSRPAESQIDFTELHTRHKQRSTNDLQIFKKQLQFISAEHSIVQFIFGIVFWLCKMTITCMTSYIHHMYLWLIYRVKHT